VVGCLIDRVNRCDLEGRLRISMYLRRHEGYDLNSVAKIPEQLGSEGSSLVIKCLAMKATYYGQGIWEMGCAS
jgi:hypothetical protein